MRRIIALPLSAYLRRYRQLAPAPAAALAAWQLPIAAARLCEGITEEEPHLLALVARLADDEEHLTKPPADGGRA